MPYLTLTENLKLQLIPGLVAQLSHYHPHHKSSLQFFSNKLFHHLSGKFIILLLWFVY